jgi:hypothetical protein
MRGPLPSHRPVFPSTCWAQAAQIARPRTVPYQLRQRAALVLLLSHQPLGPTIEAAQQGQLHLCSGQRWRRRWAQGDFSLADQPERGRKADFSPSRPRAGQGSRLCTGRGNQATVESALPGRRHCTRPPRARPPNQSQHGGAESRSGCHHTVAVQGLELSTGPAICQAGRTASGPLGGPGARPAPGSQGL